MGTSWPKDSEGMEDAAHLVPFPKGSSLVFRENTGELYSTLVTHASEDLQLELTADSLVPFPLVVSKFLPHPRPPFPHFTRVSTGGPGSLSITDRGAPLQELTWPRPSSMKHLPFSWDPYPFLHPKKNSLNTSLASLPGLAGWTMCGHPNF